MNQKSSQQATCKEINGKLYQTVINMHETASDTTSISSYNAIIGFRPTLSYVAVMNPYHRLEVEKDSNPNRICPLFTFVCVLFVILVIIILNFIVLRASK